MLWDSSIVLFEVSKSWYPRIFLLISYFYFIYLLSSTAIQLVYADGIPETCAGTQLSAVTRLTRIKSTHDT